MMEKNKVKKFAQYPQTLLMLKDWQKPRRRNALTNPRPARLPPQPDGISPALWNRFGRRVFDSPPLREAGFSVPSVSVVSGELLICDSKEGDDGGLEPHFRVIPSFHPPIMSLYSFPEASASFTPCLSWRRQGYCSENAQALLLIQNPLSRPEACIDTGLSLERDIC